MLAPQCIWSTLIGAQSLLPSYCGESQGIIGYMYDASSNPDQAREMDSHDRRNINYFYYAWALAFSLAYTIMLVGQFGFLTMANFVMLTLFRRGDNTIRFTGLRRVLTKPLRSPSPSSLPH